MIKGNACPFAGMHSPDFDRSDLSIIQQVRTAVLPL